MPLWRWRRSRCRRLTEGASDRLYQLVISDHRYEPVELKVPAGVKFKLLVENRDSTPEEFESNEFNREKIILPHSTAQIYVGPLAPGRYKFFGDFHQDTAQGVLVVE